MIVRFYELLAVVCGTLFFLFVGIKLIYRLKAWLGQPTPCPMAFAWTMEITGRKRIVPKILEWADLRPGERVLDLGCGPGMITVEVARYVEPGGHVIALDLQPEMIALAKQRIHQAGLSNTTIQIADAHQLPMEDGSVDRAILITVLPEIPHPQAALDEISRVLTAGGILSVTEEFFDPDYLFPFETIRLVESAGFRLNRFSGSFWRYTANFHKTKHCNLGGI